MWTKFESQQFKKRFKKGEVVPIWFKDSPPGMFDNTGNIGGMGFDPSGDVEKQLDDIAATLVKKMADKRIAKK